MTEPLLHFLKDEFQALEGEYTLDALLEHCKRIRRRHHDAFPPGCGATSILAVARHQKWVDVLERASLRHPLPAGRLKVHVSSIATTA